MPVSFYKTNNIRNKNFMNVFSPLIISLVEIQQAHYKWIWIYAEISWAFSTEAHQNQPK